MLSAVELHAGPGGVGIYSHHPPFGRPSAAHLQRMPLVSPTIIQQKQNSQMSETEFARPKPKSLNGSSPSTVPLSPTQKYSHHEQIGPVNLAVSHQASSRSVSPVGSDHKDIDVVGLGTPSNMIGPPLSPYGGSSSRVPYPQGLGTNAYQALNYNFYGNRYGYELHLRFSQASQLICYRFSAPLFSHRSAYPQHHPSRPTYLPPQLDSYPSYLSAAAAPYTSSSVGGYSTIASPQLPSNPEVSSSSYRTTSERSHSMPSSNNGHHPYSKEKDSKMPARAGHDSRNNNFKVPSGKEGSLKHRILTTSRPHSDSKHGTINHPANR